MDIALSQRTIAENRVVMSLVGMLSTTDPDAGDAFTYALDPGIADNDLFVVVGNALYSAVTFNYEHRNTFDVLVRSTDQDGLSIVKTLAINVVDVNDPPIDISLSAHEVAEHQPAGATIGILSTSDEDAGNSFTYSLATDAIRPDNALFMIVGCDLQTAAVLQYSTAKPDFLVRIRSVDQGGLAVVKDLVVTVLDINESPTDMVLSATSVSENMPQNTVVGTLSTVDPDEENHFSYSLEPGGVDNASFTIVADVLRTATSFNYEAKRSYSIVVRTADQGGLSFSKNFTITVLDANDPPAGIAVNNASIVEHAATGSRVGVVSATDEDPGSSLSFSLPPGFVDNAFFQIVGNVLKTKTVFNWATRNSYSIQVRATDQGGAWAEKILAVGIRRRPIKNDFDGDRRSDIGLYHPAVGNWYELRSTQGSCQKQFGYSGTLPVTGDFDGDGTTDIGISYASGGNWYLQKSTEGFSESTFGYTGMIPFAGDFDGDGRDDYGCYNPVGGIWYVMKSLEGFWQPQFGYTGTIPIVGDFDGDGRDDIGCYYPPGGNWYILKSTEGFWQASFGYSGTIPVVGDFDGDGRSDIGCYYPPGGNWYILKSTEGFWQGQFGYAGTEPVVGDYDGDGRSDLGCYFPAGGNWYILKSTEGFWQTLFGFSGTIPLGGTLR